MSGQPIDEDELELMLLRSSAGGEQAALGRVAAFVLQKSGEAFASGRDTEAKIARDLALIIKDWQREACSKLDELNARLTTP